MRAGLLIIYALTAPLDFAATNATLRVSRAFPSPGAACAWSAFSALNPAGIAVAPLMTNFCADGFVFTCR